VARGKTAVVRIRVLLLVLALLPAGCLHGGGGPGKGDANELVVTRADGSRIEFADRLYAWCGQGDESEYDPTPSPKRILQVLGGEPPTVDAKKPSSFWTFVRRTQSIERAPKAELPHRDGESVPVGTAVLFVLDAPSANRLSSLEAQSTGTVRVEEWGCDKGDEVRIVVHAKLASELHDAPSANAEGEIQTVIGDTPRLRAD
jgi:hypothetical protein